MSMSGDKKVVALPDRSRIVSLAEFVRGFVPPDYLIDGVLQRGFLYSFAGKTGSGKTAVMLRLSALVGGLGGSFGDHSVERGKVLYFAGENPDDVRMRVIAMCDGEGIGPDELEIYFLEGRASLKGDIERIRRRVTALGGVKLVVIDTARAYFEGDNENDNVQMGNYARLLRDLITTLPGKPVVVVACHPTKNASDDNLQPVGGGAFIAEVDGNLTCTTDGTLGEVHWQGKYRGPEFSPINFELIDANSFKLKDSKGRPIKTVVAKTLSDEAYAERKASAHSDEDQVMRIMLKTSDASLADIAETCGWRYASGKNKGKPAKSRVARILRNLSKKKMVTQSGGSYVLTSKGKSAAKG
jgi:AAA domain